MLHKLVNLADSRGIIGEEGFSTKRIRFLFQFSPQGEYLNCHDYGKSGKEFNEVPHLQFSGDKPARQFLVDTIEFLTLYSPEIEAFKRETGKLLAALKKEPDFNEIFNEIYGFAHKTLSLLDEGNYSEFREINSLENWGNILRQGERNVTKQIEIFLKADGVIFNVFQYGKFKLIEAIENLKRSINKILCQLELEDDYEKIKVLSNEVISLLDQEQYLELRERDFEKKWKDLLKKKGRGTRKDILDIVKTHGAIDEVFKNDHFKLAGKHQFCLQLLKQAAEAEPLLGIIAKSMSNRFILNKIHNDLAAFKPAVAVTNNATFAVTTGGVLTSFVETKTWKNWWKAKHDELSKDLSSRRLRCFLSGGLIHPILTHPKIKGLDRVGGNAETSLISFDKGSKSFQPYGFMQGENAAISAESAVKYSTVINHLLNHQHQHLAGTEIIYWYSRSIPETEDIIRTAFFKIGVFEDDDVEENKEQREAQALINAKQFLTSVTTGKRNDLQNVEYCALTLQGNQGRAVIQNWMEGRFVDLAENIEQWFSDLEIPRLSGIGSAKPPRMNTLVTCLLKEKKPKQKDVDWVRPASGFRDAMWRAAISGRSTPIPINTVRLALLRFGESMLTDEWANALDDNGEQMGMRRARLYARIGLIKAFLIRNLNQEIGMKDRSNTKNSVYWLGSLFAVLADLQRTAHQSDGGVM